MSKPPKSQHEALQELVGAKKKHWNWQAFGAGILVVFILLGIGGLTYLYIVTNHVSIDNDVGVATQPPTVETPAPVEEEEVAEVVGDFEKYIADRAEYDFTVQTLEGQLLHAVIENRGGLRVHHYYLVDQTGNTVELLNIRGDDKDYFVEHGLTTRLFRVNGMMRRTYEGVNLDVRSIAVVS